MKRSMRRPRVEKSRLGPRQVLALCAVSLLGLAGCSPEVSGPESGERARQEPSAMSVGGFTQARLQAVAAVDQDVVWVSGVEGTVARSVDGGDTWTQLEVPGAEELEFRDLHAFDAQQAILLSAGPGESSRVLTTADGGLTWQETFRNSDPEGFFNCFAFDDAGVGYLVGDPLDGALPVLVSEDGAQWLPLADRPTAADGEAGFAASGTCVWIDPSGAELILGTGGGASRLRRQVAGTWSVEVVPLPASNETSGLTSVARSSDGTLALGGGDVADRESLQENLLLETASGWLGETVTGLVGPIFGLDWSPSQSGRDALLVAGPGGLAVRSTAGEWHLLSTESHWAVDSAPAGGVAWAVGPEGRITRIGL